MRIWYQSTAPIGVDSEVDALHNALVERARKFAGPKTQISFHGCPINTPGRDTYLYSEYVHARQIIRNAVRAEREGYDVFAIGCGLDPGLWEIREITTIPVASMGESQYHFACLLGDKFTVMGHNPKVLYKLYQVIKKHGLDHRFVPGYYESSLTELASAFENPEPVIEKWMKGALDAVERGAEVILPGCTRMSLVLLANGITRVKDAPIVDVVGVLVRTAETLGMLRQISGVAHSKVCLYSSPGMELFERIERAYAGSENVPLGL